MLAKIGGDEGGEEGDGDPHSAIGVTAALRSSKAAPNIHHVALATAHSAKSSSAVDLALKDEEDFRFEALLPEIFVGLDQLPKRITHVKKSGGLEASESSL